MQFIRVELSGRCEACGEPLGPQDTDGVCYPCWIAIRERVSAEHAARCYAEHPDEKPDGGPLAPLADEN
jgi:hypothetical protein